jgi:hypothetical protein
MEDNTKMDLNETGFADVNWIHLAQDRDQWRAFLNTVKNLPITKNTGNFFTFQASLDCR